VSAVIQLLTRVLELLVQLTSNKTTTVCAGVARKESNTERIVIKNRYFIFDSGG
jgi:hypothetical protein